MPEEIKTSRFWRSAAAFAVGTVILGGMLSLRLPQGLAGLVDSLPAYLRGWTELSGVSALRLPAALLVYQPLALIFGALFALRSWLPGQPLAIEGRFLSLWVLAALALSMLYPARQVVDASRWYLCGRWQP
jgi:hypothetical protein